MTACESPSVGIPTLSRSIVLSETSGCGCAGADKTSPVIPAACCWCCIPACPFWTAAGCVEREEGAVLFMLPKGGNEGGLLADIPLPRLEEEDEAAVVVKVELAVVAVEVMALLEVIVTALLVADEGVDDGVALPAI